VAEAAPSGTSSTPPNPVADPAPATAAQPATPAEPAKAAESVPEPVKPAEPAKEPPKEPSKESDEPPLFTLPEDFKPPEAMVTKFTEFAKGLPDKKLAQGVADLYVQMAREANSAWQKQIEDTDKANAEACKARFAPEELAAAETAVGWFSSYEPDFRAFAKRQLNDPVFTNAMRLVGELLSEDELGVPSPPSRPADTRTLMKRAQETLYGRKQ
jgi:hypothetical protein